jgi:uncharacterized membrane protein YphA (DoxX/SURF4 family)
MAASRVRYSFVAFHLTLGLGLFYASARTALHAWHSTDDMTRLHLFLLGAIEAVGALLFLIPQTLRLGATLLLATIAVAFLTHLHLGDVRADLLIYAAGVWFVMTHGSAWSVPVRR